MIIDGVPYAEGSRGGRNVAIQRFLSYIEEKLGITIVRDRSRLPFGSPELGEEMDIADTLIRRGIMRSLRPQYHDPDEPQIKRWAAVCNDVASHPTSGASFFSDSDALRATLAETLERYIWTEARDHFRSPARRSVAAMRASQPLIEPSLFVGFSDAQRANKENLAFDDTTEFLWTRVFSLIQKTDVYVPVQTVTGVRGIREHGHGTEPLLKPIVTTGLATWPTLDGARLRGSLEVIERDAYMIWWLNQLNLPRVAIDDIAKNDARLKSALRTCERYKFRVHVVRLITDAPTNVVCVILEDESGTDPRFAFGLKASASMPRATEGALLEALRGRHGARRRRSLHMERDTKIPIGKIGHLERLDFWSHPDNSKQLERLVRTPVEPYKPMEWDSDSDERHLTRLVDWCSVRGYELASFSHGRTSLNPLPWHVELVLIPEMQPTSLFENLRAIGGKRLREVPESFGFAARNEPFTDAPHPFA